MRKLFFAMAHASRNDAKRRLNTLLKRDREILQNTKTEKLIKEITMVLTKYSVENGPLPMVTASITGEDCTLKAVVSLK